MLDSLQRHITNRQEKYIRIDGRTPSQDRHVQVDLFQSEPTVRVALLAISAAGSAITLTAASTVLFAELYWTPGSLLQAEDRAHRIGQAAAVTIQYLLCEGTVDDLLWPLIRKKLRVLGEVFEGKVGSDMVASSGVGAESKGAVNGAHSQHMSVGVEEDDRERGEVEDGEEVQEVLTLLAGDGGEVLDAIDEVDEDMVLLEDTEEVGSDSPEVTTNKRIGFDSRAEYSREWEARYSSRTGAGVVRDGTRGVTCRPGPCSPFIDTRISVESSNGGAVALVQKSGCTNTTVIDLCGEDDDGDGDVLLIR